MQPKRKRRKMKITRRNFLKIAGLGMLFGGVPRLFGGELEHSEKYHFWKNGKFRQTTVDTSDIDKDIIRAKIGKRWRTFKVRELPDPFMEWNTRKRLETLDNIMKGKPPELSGPHSGMVASYGVRRKDSQFTLNNAVKGIGFVPKKEYIREKIEYMKKTYKGSMKTKLEFLRSLYEHPEILNRKLQVSLELYTTPDFETHSFLNLMANPIATIVFLDIPSYEIRTIARVIHPEDPDASDYEKECVEYTNLIHSYFHGEFSRKFIGLLFYIIEVFDNTPGKKSALGQRIIP